MSALAAAPLFEQSALGFRAQTPIVAALWPSSIGAGATATQAPAGGGTRYDIIDVEHPDGAGSEALSFKYDWYERIHINPISIDLGNVVSAQERTVEVWNAYFEPHTLTAINRSDYDGLADTLQAPKVFKPLEYKLYAVQISTQGPPTVNASIGLGFDVGTYTITIVGSRITALIVQPNWARPFLERLEWKTAIIKSYAGSEQRQRLRAQPRRIIEYDTLIDGDSARLFDTLLFGWQARVYAVPFWPDVSDTLAEAAQGATIIQADTAGRNYAVGELAVLFPCGCGLSLYEIVEVAAVNAGQLTTTRPLNNTWPAGSKVAPVITGRMRDTAGLSRFDDEAIYGRLFFQGVGGAAHDGTIGETLYLGYPVMELRPLWTQDPPVQYIRKLDWYDNGIADPVIDDEAGLPIMVQQHGWGAVGRQAMDDFRKWLYARAGRHGAIWLPSWKSDLRIVADSPGTSANIDIAHIKYGQFIAQAIGRRDLRIELVDGTVLYRRILSSSEVDANTERLSLDSVLGVDLTPANVLQISWLALARLDTDAVEIAWHSSEYFEATANIRTMPHDV